MVLIVDFDSFKEYIKECRIIFYRVLENEIRINAGKVATVIQFRDENEKQRILAWLESLKETKIVVHVKDVVRDESFFI